MGTANTKKQAVVAEMSDQELGDESCRAMDLLSLAISKGREHREQTSLIKLLTVQVENKNREMQAALSPGVHKVIGEIKNDVIAGLEQVLDGYEPFLQRMALIAMLGRFDIKGIDDDVFLEEVGRRWGGLPDNAKKGISRILKSPSVMQYKKRKLKLAS
ncbi:MAG: hypothetical protein ABR913_03890 [Sedimentisphaerales bacterium]|jgi:hypothetical protein